MLLWVFTTLLGCCTDQQFWAYDTVFLEDLPARDLFLELSHTDSGTVLWDCTADEDGLPADCGQVSQQGTEWSVSLADAPERTTLRVWEGQVLLLEEPLDWEPIDGDEPGVCGADLSFKIARVNLSEG